ncbi:hypothetical protein OROGR_016066 [Orobanche gracilis]
MEAFGFLRFHRSDVISNGGGSRNADEDGETDDGDSFFDMVFESPDRIAVRRDDVGDARKDFHFIESPASSPVTLLRPTTKFKVFYMFSFRKPSRCERNLFVGDSSSKSTKTDGRSRLSVKCRVEEMPVASIVAGDNSLRSQLLKETCDWGTPPEKTAPSRDAIPKYLKLIKPLYLKVWKRHNEKAKLKDSLTPLSSPATASVKLSPLKFSEFSRAGSFKIAAKRLGKSRSASATIGVPPPLVRRRDDSLLEQQDGIQGAVLYCKKSYNSSEGRFQR